MILIIGCRSQRNISRPLGMIDMMPPPDIIPATSGALATSFEVSRPSMTVAMSAAVLLALAPGLEPGGLVDGLLPDPAPGSPAQAPSNAAIAASPTQARFVRSMCSSFVFMINGFEKVGGVARPCVLFP